MIKRPRNSRELTMFLAPAAILLGLLYFLPLLLNIALSFSDWDLHRKGVPGFAGIQNFLGVIADGTIARDVPTTILFALSVTLMQNALGLGLALAVERQSRISVFFRTVLLMPMLISALAAGYIWRGILDPAGPLNQLLSMVAGAGVDIQWLGSTSATVFVVAAVQSWKFYGLLMLIYLAGLKTIPTELKENAQIDGASKWQVFRHIKLPLIAPAVTVCVVLTLVAGFSAFDVIVAMTGGGPARSTEVVNIAAQQYLATGQFAYATTISLVLYVAVVVAGLPLIVLLRRREVYL